MNKRKILMVDDNSDNLLIMAEIFELNRPEYIVYQALNSDNALSLAKKVIPDLIITDWDMPDKDGIELIKELILQSLYFLTLCLSAFVF